MTRRKALAPKPDPVVKSPPESLAHYFRLHTLYLLSLADQWLSAGEGEVLDISIQGYMESLTRALWELDYYLSSDRPEDYRGFKLAKPANEVLFRDYPACLEDSDHALSVTPPEGWQPPADQPRPYAEFVDWAEEDPAVEDQPPAAGGEEGGQQLQLWTDRKG